MAVEKVDETPRNHGSADALNIIGGSSGQLSAFQAARASGIMMVVILAVAFAVNGHDPSTERFQQQADVSAPISSVPQSKPSPVIPWGNKQHAVPTPTIASTSAASGTGSSVAPTSVATVATTSGEIPFVLPKPRETEGVFVAKHQKSFGRGCEGTLQLTARSLNFACDAGSEEALHVAVDEIKAANGNGIELRSGEKYHFDLQRSKGEEQTIFRNWVSTHSSARQGSGAGGL